MEKLADGLQKLEEDDLLKVVQMVHEHKTQDTYIKNDVERKLFISTRCIHSLFDKKSSTQLMFSTVLTTLKPNRG